MREVTVFYIAISFTQVQVAQGLMLAPLATLRAPHCRPPDPLLGKPLAEATTHLQALGEAAASVPLGPAQAEADDARFPLNFP